MVSLKEVSIDLFGAEVPGLEELKELCLQVNSSESNQLKFAEQLEKNSSNSLAAGIGYFIAGQAAKAAELLEKASDCKQKFMYLGYAHQKLGMTDKALADFDKAAKQQVDALTVGMAKADALREAGQFDEAQKQIKSCSNFENVSAEYHYQLGLLQDAQGLYEEAAANYTTAIELDANHSQAMFRLAYAYDLRGDDQAAIDYYKQLVKKPPVHVNALLNLAVLYEDRAEYQKADACVSMVRKSHPNHQRAILYEKDIDSSMNMIYDEEKERRKDRQNQILEIPISDFELSVRSRNCLKKMNITTVGDLLRITEAELLSYKNFGETSLTEIKRILESKTLRLGMALEDKASALSIKSAHIEGASEELLNKSVDELELSVRARRALSKLGLRTFGEVVLKTEAELLGCKNFGVTSLNEIKERLSGFGLSLRTLE